MTDQQKNDRGPVGAVMDALWPILGGNQMPVETWEEISAAVTAALFTPPPANDETFAAAVRAAQGAAYVQGDEVKAFTAEAMVRDAMRILMPQPERVRLIGQLAQRGYQTPGCNNWRAKEMCRQIAQLAGAKVGSPAAPEVTRSDLIAWQTARSEWFQSNTLEIVEDYARWRDDNSPTPQIHIMCETKSEGVTGTTALDVIRVEKNDDHSFTAVTDHWPVTAPGKAGRWQVGDIAQVSDGSALPPGNYVVRALDVEGCPILARTVEARHTIGWHPDITARWTRIERPDNG